MEKITQHLYTYNPDEFMPIFRDGGLENKGEFVAYKTGKLVEALGHLAHRTMEVTVTAGKVVIEHIATAS